MVIAKTDELYSSDTCPDCGGTDISKDGERACMHCGLVLGPVITQDAERNIFDDEQREKRTRTGPPTTILLHDKGLVTKIRGTVDAYGRQVKSESRADILRIERLQNRLRVSNSKEKNLSNALTDLAILADNLNKIAKIDGHVKEAAIRYYYKLYNKGLIRGRRIVSMVAASMYRACVEFCLPIRQNDVAKASQVELKEVKRNYRLLLRSLDMKSVLANPSSFVPKILSRTTCPLEYLQKTENLASLIANTALRYKLASGKDPSGLAAASIYTACRIMGEYVTQKELSEITNMTEVTVRNIYKSLIGDARPNKNNSKRPLTIITPV